LAGGIFTYLFTQAVSPRIAQASMQTRRWQLEPALGRDIGAALAATAANVGKATHAIGAAQRSGLGFIP